MKIIEIVKLTNKYLAGEQLTYFKLLPFLDEVIDDINSRLGSTFPAFSELDITDITSDAEYSYFPDKYLRSVVAIGAAHKFYVMDEEGMTYDASYEQKYEYGLFCMQRDYIEQVPLEYQDDTTGGVVIHENMYPAAYFPLDGVERIW